MGPVVLSSHLLLNVCSLPECSGGVCQNVQPTQSGISALAFWTICKWLYWELTCHIGNPSAFKALILCMICNLWGGSGGRRNHLPCLALALLYDFWMLGWFKYLCPSRIHVGTKSPVNSVKR
jgi:hypothetical protein